jgi:hypothetical protein
VNAGDDAAVVSAAVVTFGFAAQWVLKPWRARRIADARERQVLATLASERMQRGMKVLVGEDGDPNQGIEQRDGLGVRMGNVERAVAEVRSMLNGGGLGTQMKALTQQVTEQSERVDRLNAESVTDRQRLHEEQRAVRRDLTEAVGLFGTSTDRLENRVEQVADDVTRLHRRFDEEVLPTKEANEALRVSLEAALRTEKDMESGR